VFVGSPSGSTLIPYIGPLYGVYTINASGQVVGTTSGGQGFIASTSGSSLFPLYSTGVGINDSGQVTGESPNGQAYFGTPAAFALIPFPAGWTWTAGAAVNNLGQVAGNGSGGMFIGTTQTSTPIPSPTNSFGATVFCINNSGQVVGDWGDLQATQVFIATTAGYTLIPFPIGGTYSTVTYGCLNDAGMVVGSGTFGGWIWDAAGGLVMLTELVPAGWTVDNAISISNNGLILAQAQYNGGALEYVVLSPTGPPAPVTLTYPVNGVAAISMTPTPSWNTSIAATSYDVYFGTSVVGQIR
jgi:hypothetical protein